jgi:thiol-disulfide isomerase/thioredoxin
MKTKPLFLAAIFASAIGSSIQPSAKNTTAAALPIEGKFPPLAGATAWLNAPPLTPAGLRGKVVLVEFWTYTCINWRRTLPYVRAWAEKYKNQGLVVIGAHTPEFGFEENPDNVRQAMREMNIVYPVALDSDYAIWRAFDNEYWPALYFIDAHGQIRHHQFGEGDYARSEMIIQQLLAEAGTGGTDNDLVSVDATGAEAAADIANLRSPETYLGIAQGVNFASPGGALLNRHHVYAAPPQLALNHWGLAGDWTVGRLAATLNAADGRIIYRFHARDLNLVLGPVTRGSSIRFRVLIDGQPAGVAHGADVDQQGNGTVNEPRMYQLIRQPTPIVDRQFEIEFLDPGIEVFVFTFG